MTEVSVADAVQAAAVGASRFEGRGSDRGSKRCSTGLKSQSLSEIRAVEPLRLDLPCIWTSGCVKAFPVAVAANCY